MLEERSESHCVRRKERVSSSVLEERSGDQPVCGCHCPDRLARVHVSCLDAAVCTGGEERRAINIERNSSNRVSVVPSRPREAVIAGVETSNRINAECEEGTGCAEFP